MLFSHRALQQWKQKQNIPLDENKEAAGEVTISEGKFLGHPHITFSVWFKLGSKHMAQYEINGALLEGLSGLKAQHSPASTIFLPLSRSNYINKTMFLQVHLNVFPEKYQLLTTLETAQ